MSVESSSLHVNSPYEFCHNTHMLCGRRRCARMIFNDCIRYRSSILLFIYQESHRFPSVVPRKLSAAIQWDYKEVNRSLISNFAKLSLFQTNVVGSVVESGIMTNPCMACLRKATFRFETMITFLCTHVPHKKFWPYLNFTDCYSNLVLYVGTKMNELRWFLLHVVLLRIEEK